MRRYTDTVSTPIIAPCIEKIVEMNTLPSKQVGGGRGFHRHERREEHVKDTPEHTPLPHSIRARYVVPLLVCRGALLLARRVSPHLDAERPYAAVPNERYGFTESKGAQYIVPLSGFYQPRQCN